MTGVGWAKIIISDTCNYSFFLFITSCKLTLDSWMGVSVITFLEISWVLAFFFLFF